MREVMYFFHYSYQQRMQEHITKHSPALGKDAVYTKTVSLYININIILIFQFFSSI